MLLQWVDMLEIKPTSAGDPLSLADKCIETLQRAVVTVHKPDETRNFRVRVPWIREKLGLPPPHQPYLLAIKEASEKAGLASTTRLLVQCDRLEEALRLCDEIWRDGLQLPSDGTTLPKQVEVIRPGLTEIGFTRNCGPLHQTPRYPRPSLRFIRTGDLHSALPPAAGPARYADRGAQAYV